MRRLLTLLSLSLLFLSFNSWSEGSFFSNWLDNVSKTQEIQPHWMTPLVTVTPRLEQEYRADFTRIYIPQSNGTKVQTQYTGIGKGVELIPSENTEIIVGVPSYTNQSSSFAPNTSGSGFADESLLFKYRVLTANEETGNYIVTMFMGATLPTGNQIFSVYDKANNTFYHNASVTPTIAVGKGWGGRHQGFDIQSTVSYTVPTANVGFIGKTLIWSTSFQAHEGLFWPEIETTYYKFYDGQAVSAGKNQLVITYGTTVGRFEIEKRVKAIVGVGYQTAQGTGGSFDNPLFGHAWLGTVRITF
ncbi:MAG: hypothetical protein B7Z60_02715 [Ferrovum sp. 37-45-19]|uniref:hypothetical protein n=1 Tax=Ferrovum sp. JA12 TaxID=1356299 RepID=UPI000703870E|nr:hypothetical protein [Ferrovum sp. JA12]OYV80416.1 MAG: hypothetical protein B7Z65_00785 [Ferrovum sp. 21-44-67]OYV94731.1 MAG: hypothetical protein B7Z60_02715 [Ferrovum sp. 37-45-19]OZB31869.1 MAG: hypothetical protein B7X47_07990 [Ferrovum sp. 34-44-207]HQT81153.1 hypothetical protein [Ferrovaceae bacterium]KRH79119.1 hypothetical protein FERRO_01820 [Ferrovum sp. JA12]